MNATNLKRGLLVANAVIAVLLVAAVLQPVLSSRALYLENATDATSNIALTMSQGVEAEVRRLDLALQAVIAAGAQAAPGIAPSIRRRLPEATELSIAAPSAPGRRAARVVQADGLIVAEPWRRAGDGQWMLAFSRVLPAGDGRTDQLVTVEVSAATLAGGFRSVDIGEQGVIGLRTFGDMKVLARLTRKGLVTNDAEPGTVSPEFAERMRINPQAGVGVSRSAFDGVDRASGHRRVGELPLVVLAGLGTAEFLLPWRRQAWQSAILASLLMLAVAGSSRIVYRGWQREAAAREALAAQSHRYRTLLLTANDGIHLLGLDGRLVECNEAFAAMLGHRSPADLTGHTVAEWDAKYETPQLEAWLASFKPGQKRRSGSRFRRTDGTLIDVEIHSAAMQIDGRTLVLCAARDVTDSLRLQASTAQSLERVANSEQFLQALTDNVPLRIAYVDRQARYRFINRAHLERFGLSREQIIGRSRFELSRDTAPGVASAAIEAALSGQPQQFEFHETVNGQDRVIESRMVPDLGPDGRVRGIYTVGNDVTERHAQQRRLEEALAERETLLREVYHRVKNNLQMVQSLLSLQQRALTDGVARDALAESSQRVRAMSLVHEQLYQTHSLAAVDLAGYTQELLRRLGDAGGARQRGVVLHCEIDAGHEVVLDQAVPYGLLVTELVLNSLKHAFGESGGNVRVAIERVAAAGGGHCLALRVSDDGSGLQPDFVIGDSSRQGSIGLQLAASLTAQLGGELKPLHTPRGAVFVATLTRLAG